MSSRKGEPHHEYLARRREKRREPEALAKAREHARLYRLRNPEKVKVRNHRNYWRNPGARGRLKTTYGITQYDGQDDFAKSLDVAYETIRERKSAGGPGWEPA